MQAQVNTTIDYYLFEQYGLKLNFTPQFYTYYSFGDILHRDCSSSPV